MPGFFHVSTTIARYEFSNTVHTSFHILQRDRVEARFSERLPIGPPWRLRGRVSLILAGAPEDKQTSVLCYWRGAEPAEAFTKASALSRSYSLPRFILLHHVVLTFSLLPSFPLFVSYTDIKHLSQFLSLFLSLSPEAMIVQSKISNERGRPLHDLENNSRKFFLSKILFAYRPNALNCPALSHQVHWATANQSLVFNTCGAAIKAKRNERSRYVAFVRMGSIVSCAFFLSIFWVFTSFVGYPARSGSLQ